MLYTLHETAIQRIVGSYVPHTLSKAGWNFIPLIQFVDFFFNHLVKSLIRSTLPFDIESTSMFQWQHGRLIQDYSRSKTGLSALIHLLQHIPGENHR